MKRFKHLLVLAMALVGLASTAQDDTASIYDSIAFRPDAVKLKPVAIFTYSGMSAEEISAFRGMLFRINKLYPYAQEALRLMTEADDELESLNKKKDQRKYRKSTEKDLKEEYKDKLKELSVRDSEVLIKIIERSSSQTMYEIIKKYKSGATATWYQSVAKLAGLDLKEGYNAQEWKHMEFILSAMDEGQTVPTN